MDDALDNLASDNLASDNLASDNFASDNLAVDKVTQAAIEQRLLAMKRQLLARVDQAYNDIHRREERVSADFAEQSVEMEGRQLTVTLEAEARLELRRIDAALQRLATGDYGRCQQCGKAIDQARLQAIPTAEICMRCATKGAV